RHDRPGRGHAGTVYRRRGLVGDPRRPGPARREPPRPGAGGHCHPAGPADRLGAHQRVVAAGRVPPVTTARVVPVTTEMDGDELDAEDAWHLSRRIGIRRLLLDSFVRFRYADGFSHSRALAFQIALSVVPFLLALSGLAAGIDHERPALVLARTI